MGPKYAPLLLVADLAGHGPIEDAPQLDETILHGGTYEATRSGQHMDAKGASPKTSVPVRP